MSKQTNIYSYNGITPNIAKSAFIAPTASIIGDVIIGEHSNIWFNCVLRGDVEKITIGHHTNIQDGTVVHVTNNGYPTTIGSYVTVGHKALLHACTLEDYSFVGMDATVMDSAIIESYGWLAAGSLLTGRKVIRKNEIWAGRPAKFFRYLTEQEILYIKESALNYVKLKSRYTDTSL